MLDNEYDWVEPAWTNRESYVLNLNRPPNTNIGKASLKKVIEHLRKNAHFNSNNNEPSFTNKITFKLDLNIEDIANIYDLRVRNIHRVVADMSTYTGDSVNITIYTK